MQNNTMQTNETPDTAGRPVASRTLEMHSFEIRPGRLATVGELQDDRHIDFNGFSGSPIASGRFHTIRARLEIDVESMRIEAIRVELQDVPHPECRELQSSYEQLVGLNIESGFTRAVLQKVGGAKACAHLTHLIITMGPAIVQAAFTYQTRAETSNILSRQQVQNYFIDSCYVWRADGVHAKKHG
jgi:hypothetical protein